MKDAKRSYSLQSGGLLDQTLDLLGEFLVSKGLGSFVNGVLLDIVVL